MNEPISNPSNKYGIAPVYKCVVQLITAEGKCGEYEKGNGVTKK